MKTMNTKSVKAVVASAIAAALSLGVAAPSALAQEAAPVQETIRAQSGVVGDSTVAEAIAMAHLGIDSTYVVSFDTTLNSSARFWQVGMELTDGRTVYVWVDYDTGDILYF